jgi:hypothetical protein
METGPSPGQKGIWNKDSESSENNREEIGKMIMGMIKHLNQKNHYSLITRY